MGYGRRAVRARTGRRRGARPDRRAAALQHEGVGAESRIPRHRRPHGGLEGAAGQGTAGLSVAARYTLEDLLAIMARLRDPERGCPWDVQQDFASIAPYTLEEAYEVADAIDRGDFDDLREELGDLLLQVVFHAQMASEQGLFDFADVAHAIADKMRRRHPHVFADERYADVEAQTRAWEAIKAAERAGRGEAHDASALAGISRGLPEWKRAAKLQQRAAGVGFEWREAGPMLDKLAEEVG